MSVALSHLPSRMHVVIAEFMDEAAVALASRAGQRTPTTTASSTGGRAQARGSPLPTALIVRDRPQIDADLLAPRAALKVVGRLGVGLDNIDTAACAPGASR